MHYRHDQVVIGERHRQTQADVPPLYNLVPIDQGIDHWEVPDGLDDRQGNQRREGQPQPLPLLEGRPALIPKGHRSGHIALGKGVHVGRCVQ